MAIIPMPAFAEQQPGQFTLPAQVVVTYDDEELANTADLLIKQLCSRLNLTAEAQPCAQPNHQSTTGPATIVLGLHPEGLASLEDLSNLDEAYDLTITPEGISIAAIHAHGVFNGVQSLLQLLPATPAGDSVTLDCLKIIDSPRFGWRGGMLDVGRHFFALPFIFKFLDLLAFYKFNIFHWHLTEDQGWRMEVKSHPKLTEMGAWRRTGETESYGGFYTQAEMKEVVAYAAERFIEVVPEVELPGHCGAALACYPHLSCSGEVAEVPRQWGVHEDVYCAGKEETFQFLETVLNETMAMFPCQYIHIGGDECPKVRWQSCPCCQKRIQDLGLEDEYELQSWFVSRINKFLKAAGKKLIGWDEILEGGLAEGATVMSWRGITGGVRAARAGHPVIMTPTSHCYFDYRQSLRADEPGAWYAMLPLEVVYSFDPVPPEPVDCATPMSHSSMDSSASDLNLNLNAASTGSLAGDWALEASHSDNILGGQANVWTEYISDQATVEYMTLPRLAAMAEALWSPKDMRDWEDFQARLRVHLRHYDAMGLTYRPLG
ncbi:hypothetical protein WJX72_001752 [[Myrmecia] bisecta]|uniref:Beta-hexosaminidase n=1 Tax=[Myrmecia] bisecta TaxID=41462 RepID=A0AAW1Q3C0_9CHLO